MPIDVVLGLQRGDEGKGRIVDLLSEDYDIVTRFNGGANAGHRISNKGIILALHQVPSGIIHPGILNIIGNGVLMDPVRLTQEISEIQAAGLPVSPRNLMVDAGAHLVLPHHQALDELREAGSEAQGSTKRGIAFAASGKYERAGIRADALADPDVLRAHAEARLIEANRLRTAAGLEPYDIELEITRLLASAQQLIPYITDPFLLIHDRLAAGAKILAEGAQAAMLDINHGSYPYVTSAHTLTGAVLDGLGVGPEHISSIIGVIKAVKSHVGGGPFVTELTDEAVARAVRGERGEIDGEYGASTGRDRRIGRLDMPELRRAILATGATMLVLNKLDCVPRYGSEIQIATEYEYNQRILPIAPSSARQLEQCHPLYSTLATWSEDISGLRRFEDLPENAQKLVKFIEAQLGLGISIIGVGPHHDQIITR